MPVPPAPPQRPFPLIRDGLAVVRYLVGYGGPLATGPLDLNTTLVSLDQIVPAPARDRILFVVYSADEVVAGAAVDLVFASSFKKANIARVVAAVTVEEVGTSSALEDV